MAQFAPVAPLGFTGQQQLAIDSYLKFSHPAVDDGEPLIIRSGAHSIFWSYELNAQSTPTLGGEVVQILSCFVGPITIAGEAAGFQTERNPDRSLVPGWGSFTPTDEMVRIADWFLTYMHAAGGVQGDSALRNQQAVRFEYPARGWDFFVQVTGLDGFDFSSTQVAIPWSVTAEIISDAGLDYFIAATMNTFTDDLTSRTLLAQAISPGYDQASNPFINPALNDPGSATLANRLGDNFQSLIASWSKGNFNTWGYNPLGDPGDIMSADPYSIYSQLVGGEWIGNTPLGDYGGAAADGTQVSVAGSTSSGSSPGGSTVITTVPNWIKDVIAGLPNVPMTQQNVCFFQSWWTQEGGGGVADPSHRNNADYNWLNVTAGPPSPPGTAYFTSSNGAHIAIFKSYQVGVATTIAFIKDGKYSDIISALQSGDPTTNWPSSGLITWVGPGGGSYGGDIYNRTKKCIADNQAALSPARQAMVAYINAAEANEPNWHYVRGGSGGRTIFPPANASSVDSDCSGYVSCVYHAAGLSPFGSIQSDAMGGVGRRVTNGQYLVGDLCIYPDHITVVRSAGSASTARVSSHGQESGPRTYTGVNYRGDLEYVARILTN